MKASATKRRPAPRAGLLLFLVYAAFVALGLPDGIFGVAWPSLQKEFAVPVDAIGPAMLASTAGYLSSSFFSGRLIARLSIAGLLGLSCALTGAALLGDTLVPAWWAYVGLSLLLGLGAGGVDAGLNTWVATHLGPKHMHWLHACYGLGVTGGPFLMTWGLRAFASWRPGYLGVGGLQLGLAAAFLLSAAAWKAFEAAGARGRQKKLSDYATPLKATLALPRAWLGFLLFFLYAGAEFGLGFWAYSILTQARGVDPTPAGILAGGYYGLFAAGRLLSGGLSHRVPARSLLLGGLGLALAGSLLLCLNLSPTLSMAGLVLTGFAMAPVFPVLVSQTQERVGRPHAGNAIGVQMAAAGLGASALPALLGLLAKHVSLESITAAIPALYAAILGLYLFVLKLRPLARPVRH